MRRLKRSWRSWETMAGASEAARSLGRTNGVVLFPHLVRRCRSTGIPVGARCMQDVLDCIRVQRFPQLADQGFEPLLLLRLCQFCSGHVVGVHRSRPLLLQQSPCREIQANLKINFRPYVTPTQCCLPESPARLDVRCIHSLPVHRGVGRKPNLQCLR